MRYASKDYRKVARQMLRQHPMVVLLTLICQLPTILLHFIFVPHPEHSVMDVLTYFTSYVKLSPIRHWFIFIPVVLVMAVAIPTLFSVCLAAIKYRKPTAKDFTFGLRHAPRAIGLHLLLMVYIVLPLIGYSLLINLLVNLFSWRAYWLLSIISVCTFIAALVWTVLNSIGTVAARYRLVLEPDSGIWDTFKHAREDVNIWRFDLLVTILPIALWVLLCLALQTLLALYAGTVGLVIAELLPVPLVAYAIMTLLLALDDIDTPEEAETAAPKEV